MKRLAILGSTGSIGQSTLSIVEQFPERYSVAALAAGHNIDEAFAQTVRWRPRLVSMANEELAAQLAARLNREGSGAPWALLTGAPLRSVAMRLDGVHWCYLPDTALAPESIVIQFPRRHQMCLKGG